MCDVCDVCVCLFVEFALHRALDIQVPTYQADRFCATRCPRLVIGKHMKDVYHPGGHQIALDPSENKHP